MNLFAQPRVSSSGLPTGQPAQAYEEISRAFVDICRAVREGRLKLSEWDMYEMAEVLKESYARECRMKALRIIKEC